METHLEMPATQTKPGRAKYWVAAIAGVLLIIAFLAGTKVLQIKGMIAGQKAFVIPPETVSTAKVEQMKWQASRPAVATLVAVHAVTLSSELTGKVTQLGFESGQEVHKGDLLVKLDTSVEEAQLQSALANEKYSNVSEERQQKLRALNSNTASELDQAVSARSQSRASVEQLRATIAKKTIRAPFDGRLGIRQVELGQVLAQGTPIVSLQSITPIHAEFWLPQQTLSDLKLGMHVALSTEVFPSDHWDGIITTVNPEVDVATRNIRVRATFPNKDGRLRPGMFANVEVLSNDERNALVIPATAVIYAPYGDSVFSVENKDKQLVAHQKFVRLGEHRGDLVAVVSGLEANETVVSAGAFKLHNGSTLTVRNDLAPEAQIAPRPTDK
jgi:membrane fusion protein (multidrug efflux system)